MNQIKVEIGQYRAMDKGTLKAFFSIIIYPMGQKILDCRYFVQGDKKWFNFPQKEVKYSDGRKSEYIPFVSYLNKDYANQLRESILEALKNFKPSDINAKQPSQIHEGKEDILPSESSPGWF